MPNHPLAEVFGFPADNFSERAERHRRNRLCPYNNGVPNCTKASAENPIGVCSVFSGRDVVITCPVRFRQEWIIATDAADFFFPPDTAWASLTEVQLNDKNGKSAGNIDVVLVAYDERGRITDYGALEVQSVYISGNVRRPFEYYMADPASRHDMDWRKQRNYPRPDPLSSSRKRLAPQLIFKGGILNGWKRKMGVALDSTLFATLPALEEVEKAEADLAWFVYDLQREAAQNRFDLTLSKVVYTRFEPALLKITRAEGGDESLFVNRLQASLDKQRPDEISAPENVVIDPAVLTAMKQAALFEAAATADITNVASVPQRSPFRYPGGKTWLVPRIRRWLRSRTPKPYKLVEPFAGGGIVSLTVAFEQLAERVTMVELDEQVAAVWKVLLEGDAKALAQRIAAFDLTPQSFQAAVEGPCRTLEDKAFRTILRNRVHHGGILAPGSGILKTGENGKGIASRWYPETLKRRMLDIGTVSNRIRFVEGDGLEVLRANATCADTVFFIDPPYTADGKKAGSRLYTHNQLDHAELFRTCSTLAGDFLMTYDNAESVRKLACEHGFDIQPIAMKNTHHAQMTELLISRNLDWAR